MSSAPHPSRVVTVQDLMGDWPYAYRVLHPAAGADGTPIRWSEIAEKRGITVDLSVADWYAVSGRRLHTGPLGPVHEPEVGPVADVIRPLVEALTARTGTTEVTIAEWTGYGSVEAGRSLVGATRQPDVAIGAKVYSRWRLPVAAALNLIERGSDVTTMDHRGVLANVVTDIDGAWSIRADGDLASTYIGSRVAVAHWPGELDVVRVDPGERVS